MKRILSIVVASLWLAASAEAVVSTGLLYSTYDDQTNTRPVSCFVANTSSYPRKVKVTLIDDTGRQLAQADYDLAPGIGRSLDYTFGFVVRCTVLGIGNAGEAGLRATLCNYHPSPHAGGGSAACLDAR
jgi:hypothetical protein